MGLNINNVTLAGNLTRDPESRQAGQSTVANFSVAINRRYKAGDGSLKEEVTFVEVETWGRLAETCSQYLTKGKGVYLEGRLKLDIWEKDGKKQSRLRVVAENVQFLGGGREAGEGGDAENGERPAPLRAASPAGARSSGRPTAQAHLADASLPSRVSQTQMPDEGETPF